MLASMLVVVLLTLVTALYVAAEFAFVGLRRTKVDELASEGNRWAAMLRPIVSDPHRLDAYIAACQVGITLTGLIVGAVGQSAFGDPLGRSLQSIGFEPHSARATAALLVLLGLVAFQVIVGELLPKGIAVRYPSEVASATVLPMRFSLRLLFFFIWLLNGSSNAILRLLRVPSSGRRHVHGAEEIDLLVTESHEGGMLEEKERKRMHNVFRLAERRVRDVMIPRIRVFAVSVDATVPELINIATESAYTRIPVYEDSVDHILGVVHIKDLLAASARDSESLRLRDLIREMPHVLESMSIKGLFSDMRARRIQMSLVVDEYGGTAGIVTLEDLLEEVIGDIPDEYEKASDVQASQLDALHWRVPGSMTIQSFNERFGVDIDYPNASTLNGLVMGLLGKMPQLDDCVEVENCRFEVAAVDGYAVQWIVVTLPERSSQESEADE
ncbi:MAG: HlyC/CorC family transporter [Armatimonadetes bacterium]|nr:HlyC/CorC family transporter [Armatimonadota bacterium]